MTSRSDLGSGQGSGSSHTRLQNRPRCATTSARQCRPADGPSRLLPATAGVGANFGTGQRRPQVCWRAGCARPRESGRPSQARGPASGHRRLPPWSRNPARRHRQHEPMPRNPRRVMPLPTQALDRLEPQLDPEAERVPTHPNFVRRKVGQDNPRLLLFNVPDRQQGATAFYCCLAERRPGSTRYAAAGRPQRRK